MLFVGFGMIGEIFLEMHTFHGVGIGLLLILACEEIAKDSKSKTKR